MPNPLKMSKRTCGTVASSAPTYSTATATATTTTPASAACGVSAATTAPTTPSATPEGQGERREYSDSMDESILYDDIEDSNGEGQMADIDTTRFDLAGDPSVNSYNRTIDVAGPSAGGSRDNEQKGAGRLPADTHSGSRYRRSAVASLTPPIDNEQDIRSDRYKAIAIHRNCNAKAPIITGGGLESAPKVGSFYPKADKRIEKAIVTEDFGNKCCVSFSFDPIKLECLCCGGGTFAGSSARSRATVVLSCQGFPPILPCSEGGGCLKIIRVEDGGLMELVNQFKKTLGGGEAPSGVGCLTGLTL